MMRHEELALTAHEALQENAELYSQIDSLREALTEAERERDAAVEELKKANSYWENVEASAIAEHDRIAAERDEAVKRAEVVGAERDKWFRDYEIVRSQRNDSATQLTTLRGAAETCTREYNSDEIRWDYWFDYDKVTAALASLSQARGPLDNGSPTDAELAEALTAHAANPQTPEQERAAFASSLVSDCDGVFDPTARHDTAVERIWDTPAEDEAWKHLTEPTYRLDSRTTRQNGDVEL